MPHTLETAITFPIVLSGIVLLLSAGPFLYKETADAASFHVSAVRQANTNHWIYYLDTIAYQTDSMEVVYTSPERMHFFIRAVEDSAKIIIQGVTSP